MSGSAKIAYVNTTLSKEVFSYTTNATREGNITWTNQAEYNVINFNIEASFDGFGTFGLLQNYPSYISNVSFGVVEGGFEIYHLRDSTGKNVVITSHLKKFICQYIVYLFMSSDSVS